MLGVFADDADGLGVREQVLDVARRAGRIHGDADCADVREREVDECPLEAVPREQREVVAFPHSPREEAVRVGPHALVRVRPRDLGPAVLRLDEVRGAAAARRDGVAPELRDGPARRARMRFAGGSTVSVTI